MNFRTNTDEWKNTIGIFRIYLKIRPKNYLKAEKILV